MAQLPLVTERSVKPSGQTPGYFQVNYSPDAFGAGIGRALRQFSDQLQDSAMTEKALRSEVKANDALRINAEMEDKLRPWLFDPNDGMYGKAGGAAMGVTEQGRTVMDSIKKEYLEKIEDPETKAAVEKMWFRTTEHTKDTLARHELTQLGTYKTDTTKGVLFGAMQDAYNQFNDPKAIDLAIDKTRKAIAANTNGQPPELVAAAEAEAISGIHLAVISRMAVENPYQALDYYKTHKDGLSGKDHVTATSLVETARQERASDEHFSRLTGMGGQAAHNLYQAVIGAESAGKPDAVSVKGAAGLMQLMPGTARETALALGLSEVAGMTDKQLEAYWATPQGQRDNKAIGQAYLNKQLQAFNNDVEAALVAYNAGPEAAKAFLAHNAGVGPGRRDYNVPGWKGIKNETEGYVQKVLGGFGVGVAAGQRMTPENWSLRNFKPDDLLAPTEGGRWIDARAATSLDEIADEMKAQFPGFTIKVNEADDRTGNTRGRRRGTSDPADNPHVKNSQHIHGTAIDVQIQGWNDVQKAVFLSAARAKGFSGIGFYGPDGHLHIDMGGERTWGPMPEWARTAMKTPVKKLPGGAGGSAVATAGFGGAGGTGQVPGTAGAFYADSMKPALQAWLEEAQSILDPGERERTIAKLRLYGAQQETAAAQQAAQAKNDAWQTVLAGSTSDLQPAQLARLEPGFVNSLYAYEENRANGYRPHNDGVWAKLSMLPPEELVKVDALDHINDLDKAHFDKFLDLQRAAAAAQRGDQAASKLLANTRTIGDIIKDSVAPIMSTKNSGYDAYVGQLRRKVDERIIVEQAAKGKELTPVEQQDIVDKLLISDKALWSTSPAAATEDPDAFIAVNTWEEVQQDDQRVLVNFYNHAFGKDPDKETAADLYNRAMRVYLGGKPDGPEDERSAVRAQFESAQGYKLTDSAFERYYGKWLLLSLGR